jgi:hypothetical protein
MKQIRYCFIALLTLSLVSCFELEEKIELNENNSGNYIVNVNLGGLMERMEEMGMSQKEGGEGKMPELMDSTIYFKDSVMASSLLTPEEKELIKDGTMRMKLDEKRKEMRVILRFPFSNMVQLKQLKEQALDLIKKIDKKEKEEGPDADNPLSGGLEKMDMLSAPGSDAGVFSAGPGRISYLIADKSAMAKTLQNDSAAQMLQQMSAMMGEAKFSTVIQLPRPATSTSSNAKLSADKKTVTISYTLEEVLKNPALLEYEINYQP